MENIELTDMKTGKSKSFVGFGVNGYTEKKFNYLVGRIKTIIDAINLPDKQSKSLSDLIVGEVWNLWDNAEFSYTYEGNPEDLNCKMIK